MTHSKEQLLAAGALSVGKAKTLWPTIEPDKLVMEFRNDTSAFDGEKVAALDRKGFVNNRFNAFIMEYLKRHGLQTHFYQLREDFNGTASTVYRMDMIPLESVVRNIATGSIVRRLGIPDKTEFRYPTYELFLKNDELHDPMVNENIATSMGWAFSYELEYMREYSFRANEILSDLFRQADLILVDFKLEFGRGPAGGLMLGDEFTPDGCRLWDAETMEKLDKDRFRHGLGGVVEAYEEVARRLGVDLDD